MSQQIKVTIQVFQLFETWAGLILFDLYEDLILPRVNKIVSKVKEMNIPILFYQEVLSGLYKLSQDMVNGSSIDWQMSLQETFERMPSNKYYKGVLIRKWCYLQLILKKI